MAEQEKSSGCLTVAGIIFLAGGLYQAVIRPDGETEVILGILGGLCFFINFIITEVGKWFK